MTATRQEWTEAAVVSAAWIALFAGAAWIWSEDLLRATNDATQYVKMATGDGVARAPFRYRIGVPWFAGLWPFGAEHGFLVATYTGLAASGAGMYGLARDVGFRHTTGLHAIALVLVAPATAILTLDPHLVDAWAFAAVPAAAWAGRRRRFVLLAGILLIGVLVRETALIAAAWLVLWHGWQRRGEALKVLAAAIPALAAHGAVRWQLGGGQPLAHLVASGIDRLGRKSDQFPLYVPAEVYVAFGLGWAFLWFGARHGDRFLRAGAIIAAAGLLQAFVAKDIVRLAWITGPAVVLCGIHGAQSLTTLADRGARVRRMGWGVVAATAAGGFVVAPLAAGFLTSQTPHELWMTSATVVARDTAFMVVAVAAAGRSHGEEE